MNILDTICAPATVIGTGAVSIIRISGDKAIEVTDRIVSFTKGSAREAKGYTLKHGFINDGDSILDEVIVSIYHAPDSYTGEDSTEICCHASQYVGQRILELLVDAGCRIAGPGEFTRRAFASGRMDLAQAEAVADVVAAQSKASLRVAMNQLRGGYSDEMRKLRSQFVEMTALMELELDFSDEDVEFADRGRLTGLIDAATARMESLCQSFKSGNAIKNGVPVAIVGVVNSGKSTLLNALLGEERAIVSDIAGTTRDTVEETQVIGGILFRFIDTAGLRDTDDKIERIGISRAFDKLKAAEVVLAVIDGTTPLKKAVSEFGKIRKMISDDQVLIVLRSKVDLFDNINPEEFPTKDMSYGILDLKYPAFGTYDIAPDRLAGELGVASVLDISALTGEGLDELRKFLAASQTGRFGTTGEETIVTNLRHYEALRHACDSLLDVRSGLASGTPTDLVAQDLRSALHHLGTITGEISTNEVLGEIFGKFCIGK